jgi:NAD(P)-dependent dehydrogenase (short-subunit alcohol dehydrogenase family)
MQRLDGKVAIVTGASRGLGKDIAMALARQGASVVVAARTEAEGGSNIAGSVTETVELIRGAGGIAEGVKCDVSNEPDIAAAVDKTLTTFGRIDILVNNAGILIPGKVEEIESRHWNLIFRVNVDGPFHFCRAVLPHLRGAGGGHIVNISSRGATGPGPGPYPRAVPSGGAAYGATKIALERFTQGLAAEVFEDRISVNALSPHLPIWSEGGAYFRKRSGSENYSGWRMSGDIIGDAAVVICNEEPGRFTGNVLYDEMVMRGQGGLGNAVMERYPVEP